MQDGEQPQTPAKPDTIKEVEVHGYKLNVDVDLIDDIDTLELIDEIDNQGKVAAIARLLKHILGNETYTALKKYFIEYDAKQHEGQDDYKPRMRMEYMNDTYLAIIAKFDPKG